MEEITIPIPANLETMQLPDPSLLNYWRLADNRIFYLDYEIDESALEIQKNILNINIEDAGVPIKKRKPIRIIIDSPGGYLGESMSIASSILMSKTPVYTYNAGLAASGALMVFIAGHRRYAFPNSTALYHSGSARFEGTHEQSVEFQKNYKQSVDKMSKLFLQQTKISPRIFKRNHTKEWYFSDEQQVKYGIAHRIVKSTDEVIGR